MHFMDTYKTNVEKAKWKLHKNASCSFQQTLEAAPHKTEAVQPPFFYLKKHPRKTKKMCRALLEK